MRSLILLIRGLAVRTSFNDWDWATLQLIQINKTSEPFNKWVLMEITFEGEINKGIPADIEVTHEGEELILTCYEKEVFGEIKLKATYDEEMFHEAHSPKYIPTYEILEITICGENVKKLNLSKELKTNIQSVAESYRDKMIEELI